VTDMAFPNRFGDESPFIEATARHAGNIDVTYIRAADVSPVRAIERALELHDDLVPAAANQYWIISLMQKAQAQGFGAILTGQGGNATISWRAPGHLAALARYGQWISLCRELIATKAEKQRPLWRLIAGRIVKPLFLDPLVERFHRLRSYPEPWARYSAINREFARELSITERMRQAGHDPKFGTIVDQRKDRFIIIRPGRSAIGFLWQETGAGFGLDVRDPTQDKRVMEFCLSIPDNQFVRDGRDRWLIRRAMKDLMPAFVLDEARRGQQAADIGRRLQTSYGETDAVMQSLEHSELAGRYLDLPLMRRILEKARHHLDPQITSDLVLIFFRGLMVGLFLLRFDRTSE